MKAYSQFIKELLSKKVVFATDAHKDEMCKDVRKRNGVQ